MVSNAALISVRLAINLISGLSGIQTVSSAVSVQCAVKSVLCNSVDFQHKLNLSFYPSSVILLSWLDSKSSECECVV